MAAMTPIDFKYATVKIVGGGVGQELEVVIGEGSFDYNVNDEFNYRLNRGRLGNVIRGDEQPMEVNITGEYCYSSSASGENPTIEEALSNLRLVGGTWLSLGWDTTDDREGHECDPYCVDILITYEPDCTTGVTDPNETKLFRYFRAESRSVTIQDGNISISGRCNSLRPEPVRSSS